VLLSGKIAMCNGGFKQFQLDNIAMRMGVAKRIHNKVKRIASNFCTADVRSPRQNTTSPSYKDKP